MTWRVLLSSLVFTGLLFPQTRVEIRDIQAEPLVPVQIESAAPFRAVGIPAGEHRHLRLRTRASEAGWGEWQTVTVDGEAGGLIWLERETRLLQVEGHGAVRLLLIDPGVTPHSAGKSVRRANEPALTPRSQWCPPPFNCPANPSPTATTPTHLVVHHTAGSNTATDWSAVMRSIWELHVRGNGWADIGYNFLVDPNGTAYEGRGDAVLGAHFSAVNTGTTGIAIMGTFSERAVPQPALAKLAEVLAWQARRHALDPLAQTLHAASGLELNVVSGHRDAGLSPRASGSTECPGNGLYTVLPRLREEVCRAVEGCRPLTERPNSCAGTEGPCVARNGVVSAASFDQRPLAPGGLAAVFGRGLGGLRAEVNGRAAQVVGRAETQINIQVPAATPIGTARLTFRDDSGVRAERLVWVTEAAPAVFASSSRAIAANFDDGALNSPEQPVRAGRPLTVYLTGTGLVRGTFPAGVTPPEPLFDSRAAWSATIGARTATPLFLGLTPGFIGLYQANLLVPEGLTPGDHPLVITVAGAASPELKVAVGR
jgi:uncharacterized protein (TIGR03437 family)